MMKLLRRDEFLALPPGTMFCTGGQWWFGGVEIKGETVLDKGCWSLSLDGIDFNDSGEMIDRYEDMLKSGASYPLDASYTRDVFDEDALFLVFEADDLDALIKFAESAKALAGA